MSSFKSYLSCVDYLVSQLSKELLRSRAQTRSRDTRTLRANFLNAIYFRRGITCTLGITNALIDGSQPRFKPHLRKAKPNHVLNTVFGPRLGTVYH